MKHLNRRSLYLNRENTKLPCLGAFSLPFCIATNFVPFATFFAPKNTTLENVAI